MIDRAALGEMTITLDCDVLNADGGTRCASITGAWVALSLACRHLVRMNVLKASPLTGQVAAVSCGLVGGAAVLDLDYAEDSGAEADANFVLTDGGGIVEIQGTAEKAPFTRGAVPRPAGAGQARHRAAVRAAARGAGAGLMARRLHRGARLVIASHNPGKLREIAALLAPHGVDCVSAGALGLPEPEETAPDFVGNARLKALAAARAAGLPALADDFGFCVAALGGAPGVVSARWAGPAKDFAARHGSACSRRSGDAADRARLVHRRAVPGLAGRRDAPPSSAASRAPPIWPPRGDARLRLRPDVRAAAAAARPTARWTRRRKHATSHRARAFAQLLAACFD